MGTLNGASKKRREKIELPLSLRGRPKTNHRWLPTEGPTRSSWTSGGKKKGQKERIPGKQWQRQRKVPAQEKTEATGERKKMQGKGQASKKYDPDGEPTSIPGLCSPPRDHAAS